MYRDRGLTLTVSRSGCWVLGVVSMTGGLCEDWGPELPSATGCSSRSVTRVTTRPYTPPPPSAPALFSSPATWPAALMTAGNPA